MALRQVVGEGFEAAVLRALWIQQVSVQGTAPDEDMQGWIGRFPPPVNTPWFAADAARWAGVLQRHRLQTALADLHDYLWQEYRWHHGLRQVAERFMPPAAGRLPGWQSSWRRWTERPRHALQRLTCRIF